MSDEDLRALERAAAGGGVEPRLAWARALGRCGRWAEAFSVLRPLVLEAPEAVEELKRFPTLRASIIVDVAQPDEVAAVEAWFKTWTRCLAHLSDNQGCGCCVEMWDVDGPVGAIEELPKSVRASSAWTDAKSPPPGAR